jgi:hypothetical protein
MDVQYINCNPFDTLGADRIPLRLTFVPSNALFPDFVPIEDWSKTVTQEQLNRIGQTPYLFPIQGTPTVISTPGLGGKAMIVDVLPRETWSGARLETALQAVEDSYSYAKLSACERLGTITQGTADAMADEQAAAATAAAKRNAAASPLADVKTILLWTAAGLVLFVVAVVVVKK